jgi:Pyruvate/2-oxoacid:ferredoxin oxidoreductase delta subunit
MDPYQKLALYLDTLPGGYPTTESGVEIRILKRLYTPEEAALFLYLTLIPEEPRVIAHRAAMDTEAVSHILENMAKKGLIYSLYPKGSSPQYQAFHFVCGIWEFQVNHVSPELAMDLEEYWPALFNLDTWTKSPQMRVIPINKSVTVTHEVMSYEDAEKLIAAQQTISVSPCICRQEQGVKDIPCKKPAETCLQFGDIAEFFIHKGAGRRISQKEALDVVDMANEHGLVLQPSNSKEAAFICCCCSCCCAVLKNIKRSPQPASIVMTPYIARIQEDQCRVCENCIDRCPMEAISNEYGKMFIQSDRCIGCGLCVSKCPTYAVQLFRKSTKDQKNVPRKWEDALITLAKDRGKISLISMIGMLIKSKYDRLRSLRKT